MRHLKILALAAVAASALMAMVGPGFAGAETTLCKATESPCSEANRYGVGTEFATQLQEGERLVMTPNGEQPTIECSTLTFGGKTETATTPEGKLSQMAFQNCNITMEVLETGKMGFHWDAEHSGRVTISGLRVRYKAFFGSLSCDWGGTVTSGMTLTGGAPATIDMTATVPMIQETGFIECPPSAVWHAEFTVTNPTPLYVSKGL